ncbi:MAG: GntR family transcriptional regulator [Bacteroidales bacterium]|jgi:DNA-binding transcriptional regulator YhcF (GntR family)|nr:GntR family transcriptional regulator [Bacteroidales bacterium]
MAEFNTDRAIFLQIADRISDDILAGKYKTDERIPSVREYAAMLQVNVNTAMKTIEYLSREGIVYKMRGMGYYVTAEAKEKILEQRRQEFMTRTLPELFKQMELQGISIETVVEEWGRRAERREKEV